MYRMMSNGVSAVAMVAATMLVSGGANAQEANLEAARALIESARTLPAFEAPGEAFDAKACMADKKVYVIPLTSENPFNVEIGKAQQEAAEAVGFELTVSDNQLNVDQWVQAVQTAISEGYDAIDIMGGVPPEAMGPQLAEARAAGIKVVATHLYDVTQTKSELVDGNFAMNYSGAGEIMAAWAMDKTPSSSAPTKSCRPARSSPPSRPISTRTRPAASTATSTCRSPNGAARSSRKCSRLSLPIRRSTSFCRSTIPCRHSSSPRSRFRTARMSASRPITARPSRSTSCATATSWT